MGLVATWSLLRRLRAATLTLLLTFETLDNFSDSVDASLEGDSGDLELAGGASLS
jgi:hypothetical protein